jgi:hypothetical protein
MLLRVVCVYVLVLLLVSASSVSAKGDNKGGKGDGKGNGKGDGSYADKHGHDKPSAPREPLGTTLIPMYQGFGSHYVFMYVGSPPRRQSLVVDTANHFTAFPCHGCKDCGTHVDPIWDPTSSTSAFVPNQCPVSRPGSHNIDNKCVVGQTYKDGSSWEGFVVKDSVHLAGLTNKDTVAAESYDFNFTFICETQETEIFKSQLANGVLGLSRSIDTLPMMMRLKRVTSSASFGLCFRIGGGIMTVGGVDERLHKGSVQWLRMADVTPLRIPGNNINLPPIAIGGPNGDGGSGSSSGLGPVMPSKHEDFDDDDDDDDDSSKNRKQNSNGDDDDASRRFIRGRRRLQPSDIFDASLPSISGNTATNRPTPPPGQISTHDLNRLSLYSVALEKIVIMTSTNANFDADYMSFEYNSSALNQDRGCIIDSAATDITVPSDMLHMMMEAFSKISGVTLSPEGELTVDNPKQLNTLPMFRFVFKSAGNDEGDSVIDIPFSTYLDQTEKAHRYAVRVQAKNVNGGVNLGSKFFLGRNVIFDVESRRIGLADSDCRYEDYVAIADGDDDDDEDDDTSSAGGNGNGSEGDTEDEESEGNGGPGNNCRSQPIKACSAKCDQSEDVTYVASGTQLYENVCDASAKENRPCSLTCDGNMIVRGTPQCPDSPWKECSADGIQKRHIAVDPASFKKGRKNDDGADDDENSKYKNGPDSKCTYQTETRICYTDQVPVNDGDYLIFIDMKFPIMPQDWSYVHQEVFFQAFHQLFRVRLY